MDKTPHTTPITQGAATRFHHSKVVANADGPITVWVAQFDAMIDLGEPMVTDVYRTRAQAVQAVLEDIEVAAESIEDTPLTEAHIHCDECDCSVMSTWSYDDEDGNPLAAWAVYPKVLD